MFKIKASNVYDRQMEDAISKNKVELCEKACKAIMDSDGYQAHSIVGEDVIIITIPRLDDEEQAPVADVEDIQEQFNHALKGIESDNENIVDGWNDKQRDYARDSQ